MTTSEWNGFGVTWRARLASIALHTLPDLAVLNARDLGESTVGLTGVGFELELTYDPREGAILLTNHNEASDQLLATSDAQCGGPGAFFVGPDTLQVQGRDGNALWRRVADSLGAVGALLRGDDTWRERQPEDHRGKGWDVALIAGRAPAPWRFWPHFDEYRLRTRAGLLVVHYKLGPEAPWLGRLVPQSQEPQPPPMTGARCISESGTEFISLTSALPTQSFARAPVPALRDLVRLLDGYQDS